MTKNTIYLIPLFFLLACRPEIKTEISPWVPHDETEELAANAEHEKSRMQFKLIQSKYADKNEIWKDAAEQIKYFGQEDYLALKPLIFEQDIPTIQSHISSGKLTYEKLTQWYIYRMVQFENDKDKSLHSILAINPNALTEARQKDKNRSDKDHPIYGMPILLKDNINTAGMKTTAGAHALKDNQPSKDAFIVEQIKAKGGIILGKVNLSEWAYYLCQGCPLGYSAIGGQTLNPYGRKQFETGGSSAGSGTTMAANYAAAAVGTETSGSILSPSSQNSVVGLKPTIGLLSRTGIVPISSTLDTPGPMTRNVIDNAILLSAMSGEDTSDDSTKDNPKDIDYWKAIEGASLKGLRLGANKSFMKSDSIYKLTVEKIKSAGAMIFEFEPEQVPFDGFLTLLNIDMKNDLPKYLKDHAGGAVSVKSVKEVVDHNLQDTMKRVPYGQALFVNIVNDTTSEVAFQKIKSTLHQNGKKYLDTPMDEFKLDAILSINNYNAGHAALAKYPCITVPMGYKESGEPISLTFIARPFEEAKLLQMGIAFEKAFPMRKTPKDFQ